MSVSAPFGSLKQFNPLELGKGANLRGLRLGEGPSMAVLNTSCASWGSNLLYMYIYVIYIQMHHL